MQGRGIGLFAGTSAEVVEESARTAEALGYSSFWLNHPGAGDAFPRLADAARATDAIALGIGVVPLHLRDAASVVEGVQASGLPAERLLLGIGTSGKGAYALAREGVARLRDELGCRVVMAALSEGACRLAGEIADGVLFNWLTPEYARRSVGWVAEGAAAAGRSTPRSYAYVRVALGAGAAAAIEVEGTRYVRVPSYGSHFERMGVAPVETAVVAAEAADVARGLEAWDGVVDEIVLRLLPSADSLEAHLELIRAGVPG
jgi:alkanesulfonate monooxygenase SsuD/methylene tetrahydromethanopterin reductase-like flavin-dependent oxidoreductase (luciferase family)